MRGYNKYQRLLFASLLILLAVFFYALHYAIFKDAHHIFIYLLGDIGFLFVEVLIVTLIIHQILTEREKRAMLKKMSMVIGAFFSEVGTELLRQFNSFDSTAESIGARLIIDNSWSPEHFDKVEELLTGHKFKIDSKAGNLKDLHEFIVGKRNFLLRLLENPNLLEHESFTELLWAVFHLAEEMSHRSTVENLPENDYKHLSGDILRAHRLLVREWLEHMKHLKADYPYLFSLAIRTNPFNPAAKVEVT
jgi:hypothetical protein